MIGLFSLMILAPAQGIEGEKAISMAQDFASRAGYKSPYSLTYLNKQDRKPWDGVEEQQWSIGLKAKDGDHLTMNVSLEGQVIYFCRILDTRGQLAPPNEPQALQRGKQLFERLPHKKPVIGGGLGIGAGHYGMDFHLLLRGRRFFNLNPTYGYRISFDPAGSKVTWFGARDELPPVNTHEPKLSSKTAGNLFLKHASAEELRRHLDPFRKGALNDIFVTPQLGYYKPKGAKAARLVYLGVANSKLESRKRSQYELPFFIDAVSGKTVAQDDR
jgi:hypothetical protein